MGERRNEGRVGEGMKQQRDERSNGTNAPGGLAGWLLEKLRRGSRPRPRLALLERIALAPRQSLALVEADGRRLLVATSPEGAPAFYALDASARRATEESAGFALDSTASQTAHRIARPGQHPVARRPRQRTARASW